MERYSTVKLNSQVSSHVTGFKDQFNRKLNRFEFLTKTKAFLGHRNNSVM